LLANHAQMPNKSESRLAKLADFLVG